MTSGLEMDWVYSGFGASQIYHSLTYLDTYLQTRDTYGQCSQIAYTK